jgi:uracil-DNA glycosylase
LSSKPSKFPESLPTGWQALLKDEFQKPYFKSLLDFLKDEREQGQVLYPEQDKVMRALHEIDFDQVKVVILGQDPYHGPGQAIGLSFAVQSQHYPKPPSLVNIFKELETDLGLKADPKNSELSNWVKQGVLMLNTVLTVRQGQAFSHQKKGWEQFTDRIISLLGHRPTPCVFILWGNVARKKKELIDLSEHFIVESAHPSPLSAHAGFFGSKPFSKTNLLLTRRMRTQPIDWSL